MLNRYFATVARGLEALACAELIELGAIEAEPGFCGVAFQGDVELLYRVNLWARLPFRILLQIATFPGENLDDIQLYEGIQAIDWQPYLNPELTLAVTVTGKTDRLNHSHFSAVQVKRAIVDGQQRQWGSRSNVDPVDPDVRVNVHLDATGCTVSLDSSGSSLHRRGYRAAVGDAPLKESLASALLKLSGWTPDLAFVDPLCGSGTLPLEAVMQGLNIAPGIFRERFGFESWPSFDEPLFDRLFKAAEAAERQQLPMPIVGSDRNGEVLAQAQANAHSCGVDEYVQFYQQDLATLEAPAAGGILLCNPPYGARLGRSEELGDLYRLLGDVLKHRFKGWTAYILSGNKALAMSIGLRSAARTPVYNGTIPCQLMKYELY
jgi:putative N6-adenine-specific DNA methylase